MFLCNILGHLLHCCCSCVWALCIPRGVELCIGCYDFAFQQKSKLCCPNIWHLWRTDTQTVSVMWHVDLQLEIKSQLKHCFLLAKIWQTEMWTFLKNPIEEIQTKSTEFKECIDYSRGKARVSWSPSQSCCEHWQRNSGRYTPFAQFPLLQNMIRDILTSKCHICQIITSISNIL